MNLVACLSDELWAMWRSRTCKDYLIEQYGIIHPFRSDLQRSGARHSSVNMASPEPSRPSFPSLDTAALADPQASISAYYSLVFPNFTYFLQTLSVTIGRRCSPAAAESSSSSADKTQVDVDLGPLKSVSRLHARIEYEEEEERFVLVVVGRNGAWVDGVWSGSGSKVPLSERCDKICDLMLRRHD